MRIALLGYLTGAICLAVGIISIVIVLPTAAGAAMNPSVVPRSLLLRQFVIGLVFVAVAARLWWGSIKRTDGDDVLTGQRGLLVGLMVATAALFAVAMLGLMFLPEFWAGAISGVMDAMRDATRAR